MLALDLLPYSSNNNNNNSNFPIYYQLLLATLCVIFLSTTCSSKTLKRKWQKLIAKITGRSLTDNNSNKPSNRKSSVTKNCEPRTTDTKVMSENEVVRFIYKGKTMEAHMTDIKPHAYSIKDDDCSNIATITDQKSAMTNTKTEKSTTQKIQPISISADVPAATTTAHRPSMSKHRKSTAKEQSNVNVSMKGREPKSTTEEKSKSNIKHLDPNKLRTLSPPDHRKDKRYEDRNQSQKSNKMDERIPAPAKVSFQPTPPASPKPKGGNIKNMFEELANDPRVVSIITEPPSNSEDDYNVHRPTMGGQLKSARSQGRHK